MRKFLFIFLIISPYLLFGQNVEINKLLYVSATSGLRVRYQPSLDGYIVKVLPYGEMLLINGRTANKESINGINDYWYSFYMIGEGNVWVFGGFLSEYLENNHIIGWWSNEANRLNYWLFEINNSFANLLRQNLLGFKGTYSLYNNNLILNYMESIDYEDGYGESSRYTERREGRIRFININRIELTINNQTIILKRENSYY